MKILPALLCLSLVLAASCRQLGTAAPHAREPWSPVALPAPRHGHRIERVGDGLLSFGGFGGDSVPDRETRQTWWLARGAAQWQRRADMNTGRAFFGSVVVDGIVYAIGDGVERYDAAADRWIEVVASGNLPTSHFAAAATGHRLHVIGGATGERQGMYTVNLDTGAVGEEPAPPGFARGDHFHFAHNLGGRLHVIGGLDGANFRPRAEHWVLTDDGWMADAAPPVGMWAKFTAQALVEDKLYLFGDFGAFCYDSGLSVWTSRAELGVMMAMPQAVAIDGSIWVIGGMPVEGERSTILLRYDIAADAWR